MNRSGFVFTTIAILVVISMLFLFATQQRMLPRTLSQTDRVQIMDTYLTNLENDLPRAAYISGYRALIAMEEHISSTGIYLVDVDGAFTSVFENGSINGSTYTIMENSTFGNFASAFAQLANEQGIEANVTVVSVQAYQEDPWFVTLNITIRSILADTAGTASFDSISVLQSKVPIDNIKDPLYTVSTQGRVPHTIVQSTISRPYIDNDNVTVRLQQIYNGSLYTASVDAPSFLQRFSGNFSPSPYGIESLVRVSELDAQGISVDTCKSIVDHLYFADESTAPNNLIVNMDGAVFWLDDDHLDEYDATNKVVGTKPCT